MIGSTGIAIAAAAAASARCRLEGGCELLPEWVAYVLIIIAVAIVLDIVIDIWLGD